MVLQSKLKLGPTTSPLMHQKRLPAQYDERRVVHPPPRHHRRVAAAKQHPSASRPLPTAACPRALPTAALSSLPSSRFDAVHPTFVFNWVAPDGQCRRRVSVAAYAQRRSPRHRWIHHSSPRGSHAVHSGGPPHV